MVPGMRRRLATALVVLAVGALGSQVLSACGDKFVLLGRGVRFQRAYAAIHPAAILLVIPPKSVKNAAVRDSRLQSALKMAGHQVDVVPAASLTEALARARYDIILAERADAVGIADLAPAAPRKAAVLGILEKPSAADLAAARQRLDGVITTPQPLPDILRLLDDVMKARLERARAGTF
jgi:hypothetical protein